MNQYASEILDFWFKKSQPKQWFEKNNEYDNSIKEKFLNYHNFAVRGDFESWKNKPYESLSFIILIDQFSRNIFRDNVKSYKYDYMSLEVSKNGIKSQFLQEFNNLNEKFFYILPLIHSEDIHDQNQGVKLANEELKIHSDFSTIIKFFDRHKEIIEKFNRFPHRNKILNRKSTVEEIAFLKTPFSSF